MSPYANYTFRVIGENKMGPSEPSAPSEKCTTLPDVPYKNPGIFNVINLNLISF